ncbi:MAG: DUF6259 domain-containing protein [Oscillospiraceae bacterium]|nr:DUF6259 domain-containing protein [Oscillospiraceae bacterium]
MITCKNDGKIISFENANTGYSFELSSGRLLNVYSKTTGWNMIKRPEFAQSFVMMIPLDGRRNNLVEGGTPTSVNITDTSVEFVYDTVTSKFGGEHPIKVVTKFEIDEEIGTFGFEADNQSDLIIEDVRYPIIDDFTKPEDEKEINQLWLGYSNLEKQTIYPRIKNLGYWGTDSPTQFSEPAPYSMFHMLAGEKQGVYIGAGEKSTDVIAWKIQLFPGYDSSITQNVPEADEISGHPRHLCITAAQLPYIMPKTSRRLVPIVIRTFEGTWHKGADVYKYLVKKWGLTPVKPPVWVAEPHSWLQIHINSPEDELRYKYTELVDIGRECAKHGIAAIQLVGWNDGGQDRGNPSHSHDPRLGTFEELKQAIAEIQAMGVKVILFSKFTWADQSTEWFRDELIKLAAKDPYGDYYMHPGYQYQTISQHMDISTRKLIAMCMNSEKYRAIADKELKKIVDLGAEGTLYDESQHHGYARLCFDESHGHRYGESVYKGDNPLIEGFRKVSASNPDFLYAGEACYDIEFEQYHLTYMRSHVENFVPGKRYVFPHVPYMTAIVGFNDRNMVNQCLMNKFIISYEPYNFKGRPGDYPLTLEYGKKMDALRTELREYFWDGDFLDTTVGSVTVAGKPHELWTGYRTADGKFGAVISNYSNEPLKVKMKFDENLTKYRFVDGDDFVPYTEEIEIPPQSAVVVI